MTPEIRLEAVKIASAFNTDIDKMLESAGRLVHFIAGSSADAKQSAATERVTKTKPAATESTQSANSPPADPAPPSASAAAQQPTASILSYDEHIKPLIKELAVLARTELLAILKKFNAPKGPDIKPTDLAAAKKDLETAVATAKSAKAS